MTRVASVVGVIVTSCLLGSGLALGQTAAPGGRSVADLVAGLRAPSPGARVEAAAALAAVADPAASPHLIAALRTDPAPEVRRAAGLALHVLGTEDGRVALAVAASSDPDPQVREAMARLVGAPAPPTTSSSAGPAMPAPESATAAQASTPIVASTAAPDPTPRRRSPGRGLRISGWALTGFFYGSALLVGMIVWPAGAAAESRVVADFGWKLMIPVVGPALAAATTWHGPDAAAGNAVILNFPFWIWTFCQVAGVVLLGVGYGRRPPGEQAATGRRVALAFAPAGPGGTPGVSVGGWFF